MAAGVDGSGRMKEKYAGGVLFGKGARGALKRASHILNELRVGSGLRLLRGQSGVWRIDLTEYCPYRCTLLTNGKINVGPGVIMGGTSNYIYAGHAATDGVDPSGETDGGYHLLAAITADIELGDISAPVMALYDDTEFGAAVAVLGNQYAVYRRIAYVTITSGKVTSLKQCCHSDLVVTMWKGTLSSNLYHPADVIPLIIPD